MPRICIIFLFFSHLHHCHPTGISLFTGTGLVRRRKPVGQRSKRTPSFASRQLKIQEGLRWGSCRIQRN